MKNRLNVALDATLCSSKNRSFEITYGFQLKVIRLRIDGGVKSFEMLVLSTILFRVGGPRWHSG